MVRQPVLLVFVLLALEAAVISVSEHRRFKHLFKVLPAVFWIYFLPMVLSTAGIIPSSSPVYQTISVYLLPISLVLLFVGVNLPDILKLGRHALTMMLAGSFGIILGAPIVLFFFRHQLPPDAWLAFGALSGSWVGGSANMLAVKEALGTPDAIFVPMIAVDIAVSYSWMGILIALAAYQSVYDRWNRSDRKVIEELNRKTTESQDDFFHGYRVLPILGMLALAAATTLSAIYLTSFLPETKGVTKITWTILTVSMAGALFSFTGLRKLQSYGASKIGYLVLYFVLTSMGAKANLRDLASAPLFVLIGFILVVVHFLFMLIVSKLTKAPLSLVATASQANIGGPVSAPIVGAIYEPSLAPVGLLLGIFGNLIGTYTALFCAKLCYLAVHYSP